MSKKYLVNIDRGVDIGGKHFALYAPIEGGDPDELAELEELGHIVAEGKETWAKIEPPKPPKSVLKKKK